MVVVPLQRLQWATARCSARMEDPANLDHMRYTTSVCTAKRSSICASASCPGWGPAGAWWGFRRRGSAWCAAARDTYALPGSGKCVMEYAMRLHALAGAKQNVNCNAIVPGPIAPEAWTKIGEELGMQGDELLKGVVERRVPMNRPAEPKAIGGVVAFLCGEKGRYVTGVCLPVDGGMHLT